jgi:glyoxylase-like metal-dependent hydrolase (beta-lactamase superfamily II)
MSVLPALHALDLGPSRVTLIHDGELDVAADLFFKDLPRAAWAGQMREAPGGLVTSPVAVVLVQRADEVILMDTGLGGVRSPRERGGALAAGLAALGVTPEAVTRVVISHFHGDHIWGAVRAADGAPTYPRARYHVPRPDAEWVRRTPGGASLPILAALERAGQLVLDEPESRLTPWLRSVDTAGHSPGHRCLVLDGDGQTFCFLGDLVHHAPLHFAHPAWVTGFDYQPRRTPDARRRLARQAVAGGGHGWLLAAAHAPFPALGRLTPAGDDSWTWVAVDR